MRWKRLTGPFSSRNYRLYFAGQIVSLMGTWMSQTASMWLVYHISASPFLLGVVGFASLAPTFFLGPLAGVWVDRVNRHKLLVATQVGSMIQSFLLAGFTLADAIDVSHIIALSLLQGVINAIDMPVRQAMVVEFVENREQLGNAIALNSSLFNLARLVGPAIGGFIIAAFGAGICFLIDGFSYLAVIFALLAMQLKPQKPKEVKKHPWVELREGFRYAFGFPPIKALILLVAAFSATGFSYSVLMPVFAKEVFHGDAKILGLLMSSSGIGALAGALYLGTRSTVRGLGNVITFGGVLMALGVSGFAMSHWLALSMVFLACAGTGGVLLMASSNTLVQTFVDDDKRGRVMSLFTMAFTGTVPVGNLIAGSVANTLGSATTLLISGTICLIVVMVFYRKLPRLREAAAPILARLDVSEVSPPAK
ncbi:MAG TPA: MFS transporter [Verrucomicrobiae bacterium]